MDLISELIKLPSMCIYALINQPEKKIYLGFTTNIVTALGRITKDIKYSNEELNNLPFVIIESPKDRINLYARFNYWYNYYSNKGYLFYNKNKPKLPIYKVRIDLMSDFRLKYETSALCYVKLVTRGYKELIVGIFKDYETAQEWTALNYSNGEVNKIVYSNNDLTKDYNAISK